MTAPSNPVPERDVQAVEDGPRLWLSALADGDRDGEALARGAAQWRDDAAARESWHLYHLIGDVLRSEDLASTPKRDAAFVDALRERLAREPVPLAPAPLAAPPPLARRLGWRAPVAVAAGFAVVATALVLMRPLGFGAGPAAQGDSTVAGGGLRAVPNPLPSVAGPLVADGSMIRDAKLDAYLRAHQSVRGNLLGVLPGGGMRNAEVILVPMAPPPNQALPVLRVASEPR